MIASFSFITGLVFWPAALPALFLDQAPSRKIGVWLALSLATLSLYFAGFTSYPERTLHMRYIGQAKDLVIYFFLYLGSPFGTYGRWSFLVGLLGLLALVAVLATLVFRLDRQALRRLMPWCTLALFAMGCAAFTALGRLEFGVGQALTSRYVSFGNLLWLSLPVLALCPSLRVRAPRWSWSRLVFAPLVTAMFLMLLLANLRGARAMAETSALRLAAVTALRHGDLTQPVAAVHPNPESLSRELSMLQSRSLSLFRPDA